MDQFIISIQVLNDQCIWSYVPDITSRRLTSTKAFHFSDFPSYGGRFFMSEHRFECEAKNIPREKVIVRNMKRSHQGVVIR
jgi:hypothetical protein